MKKYSLTSILLISVMQFSLAQSITINANNLQLPKVSVLPACVAADYGKMVFLTTTNKAQVCNATGWVAIDVATAGLTIPINSTTSISGGALINVMNSSTGANSIGIKAESASGNGGIGISGIANQQNPVNNTVGVYGYNNSINSNGVGVYGRHFGYGWGVLGVSDDGIGVEGRAMGGTGVKGMSVDGTAILGTVSGTGKAGLFQAPSGGIGGQFEASGTNSVALLTSGAVRFTNIGEGGTTSKFLKSDANGVATWQTMSRNEIMAIPSCAFMIDRNDSEYSIVNSSIQITSLATGTTGTLYAPVNVPTGATITSFRLLYYDNGTAAITSCELQAAPQSTGTFTSVSSLTVPTTNSAAMQSVVSPTLNIAVDNDTNIYRIAVTMGVSPLIQVQGVELRYTYSSVN